jgi:predicted nuclease with TOPRIM domain
MWPFRQRLDQAHLELVGQIHAVLQRVKAIEETLAALEDKHERLRGRFYATRPQLQAETEQRQLTKEQILARFVPPRRG